MQDSLREGRTPGSIPIALVMEGHWESWLAEQDQATRRWLAAIGCKGKAGSSSFLPGADGQLARVVVVSAPDDPFALGGVSAALPQGDYHLDPAPDREAGERLALGWALGTYQFTRYKPGRPAGARLALESGWNGALVRAQAEAVTLVRDLINTPAEEMMPDQLAAAAETLAREFGADFRQIVADELLEQNYPAIHAVGRASACPPRLVELNWGDDAHPGLTLVGKGVCFDSGGLDIKPASGMRLMKKDMGGAAHALGLARLVMALKLPVRLRVLVPAVENAIAGNALRPGDVIRTRKGLTVEIDNTDAEGRVILSDALAEGAAGNPALMLDFATLTGAARVALGTEVPALFSNDDALAEGLLEAGQREGDPLWRLPLHGPYRELIDSKIADLANASGQPFGGAITAALFLQAFVPKALPWAHLDLMAWNNRARPGRPEGGEAMGLRAAFAYLHNRFGP
ncbi:MAG: leucyl aminopeptidase family protein [Candidatus Competibacteraceae bacterium]|nr:leucyl aminopeptidase family protein [Candidatus Competibacteraceae bacterium]